MTNCDLLHYFFKTEHPVRELIVQFIARVRIFRVRMIFVEKLYNIKSAAVDIEMDIPFFKIWSHRFPNLNFRMEFFHRAPCSESYALTMFPINFDNNAASFIIACHMR